MKISQLKDIPKVIDHSLLAPEMTDQALLDGIQAAQKFKVASVCIKPYFVTRAVELLEFSGVAVGSVVGFPHGGHRTAVKIMEAHQAIQNGATELDMVVNIGKVLSEDWLYVETDIRAMVNVCKTNQVVSKIIFETCFLREEHKVKLCELCQKLGADFVKTSTGFGPFGATPEDVKLLFAHVQPPLGVKASGGIRTRADALRMLASGANRIGTSAGIAIVTGAP